MNHKTKHKTTTNSPIYLTRGGNINVMYGALRAAEYSGALWSGTMHFSTSNAYDFHASDVRIFPVDNNGRLVGFTGRAVFAIFGIETSQNFLYI